MHAVILTVHGLIVLALIVIVLLQRSEGGALGMGGGGGGFMTSRGAANVLTRTTSVLAALFFLTSIALALTARSGESDTDIIQDLTGERVIDPTKPLTTDDLLDTLGSGSTTPAPEAAAPSLEAVPADPQTVDDSAPAAPTPEADASAPVDPAPEAPAQPN